MKMPRPRTATAAAATAALTLLLAACGGGGDGGTNLSATAVTAFSTSTPRYSQDLIITLQGRNLDRDVSVNATGCATLSLITTAPNVSTPTTAYYRCTRPALGAQRVNFLRTSDSVLMAGVSFTVPQPVVTLSVSNGAGVSGNLEITLEAARAPITVTNFLDYVNAGFYTDTVFHRFVPGFIAQGGGYAKTLTPNGTIPALKSTNAAILLEDNAGLLNLRGTLAMARTNAPNSATSQFFINLADNSSLDRTATARGYAVFGTITAGTDVVTAITAAPCSPWPAFFGAGDGSACLLSPNVVVSSATQTR